MAKNFRGLVLFGVLGIFFLGGIAAQEKLVGDQRPTGLIPLSSEETEAILKSWPRINKINVNWLGFERINKVKAKKGKALLDPSSIRPIGQEVDSSIAGPGASVQSIVTNSELAGDLPAYVDNSKLKYFPPVRSQGTLSSCLPFAVVYYQLSYMAAFQRNLDIRDGNDNSNKYSPKWVYNMINGGFDNGTAQGNIYSILQNHGACTWDEFPYDNDYLSWCLNTNAWRNALFVKTNPAQYLSPVSSEQYLALVKGLLTNGYILEIGTCILSWQSKTVLDDPSTTDDDSEVGKNVAFWVNGTLGAHAMVIVGYNDAIWTDINGNGIIDAGEKGAFRLANPWGDWWQDGGFGWMAYDALRSVSAVADGPSEGRTEAFLSDMAFVLTVTDNYSPLVTAEFTVNHAKRNQLRLSLGRSDISATAPTTEWFPAVFQNQGGAYAFNGTNTPIDGTFVLDFSDLLVDGSGSLRYYIGMNDNTSGDSAILSAFKIIDRTFEPDKEVVSSLVPQYADGDQQAYAYVDYAYSGYVYNHAPIVSYAQASPLSGTTLDTYTYYVKYYDQDGDVPLIKNVYIDGNPHTMIFESGNSASDGWYQFQTALSPGSHNFYFYFEDNHADSGRDPFMGTLSGPVVVLPHLVTRNPLQVAPWLATGRNACLAEGVIRGTGKSPLIRIGPCSAVCYK